LSVALAIATWLWVRDRPEELGYPPAHAPAPTGARLHWTQAVARVAGNPTTWPAFFVNFGVGGSYLAFAGLWAVPYLQQVHGMSAVQGAQHTSLLLLGVAFGSVGVGALSDRLRSRTGVMRVFVLLYTLSWLPWIAHVQWPIAATLAWFFLTGLLIPGFTLSWTIAKEANPPEYSGIATSIVNVGIFLGTGILQPLVGWLLDRGRSAGDLAAAWDRAILLLAGVAAFALAMTLAVGRTGRGPQVRSS
jgi:sugar phosphate permease